MKAAKEAKISSKLKLTLFIWEEITQFQSVLCCPVLSTLICSILIFYSTLSASAQFNRNRFHSEKDKKLTVPVFALSGAATSFCKPAWGELAPDNSFLVFLNLSQPTSLKQPQSKFTLHQICRNHLCRDLRINTSTLGINTVFYRQRNKTDDAFPPLPETTQLMNVLSPLSNISLCLLEIKAELQAEMHNQADIEKRKRKRRERMI